MTTLETLVPGITNMPEPESDEVRVKAPQSVEVVHRYGCPDEGLYVYGPRPAMQALYEALGRALGVTGGRG